MDNKKSYIRSQILHYYNYGTENEFCIVSGVGVAYYSFGPALRVILNALRQVFLETSPYTANTTLLIHKYSLITLSM